MNYFLRETLKPGYLFLTNAGYREFIKLQFRYGKTKRFQSIKDIHFLGFKHIEVADAPSFIWQVKELFADEIYKFSEDVSAEHGIIDCGVNIGMSLLYFAKLYPNAKILGFEADSDIADICKRNVMQHSEHNQNIEVINSAVWIHNEGIEFSIEGGDGGSINGAGQTKKVSSIRLKDYLQKFPVIDFLKIDIEGAEYEVLKDCANTLHSVKKLFVEYHSWNNTSQHLSEILAILEKNNFRYYIQSVDHRKHPLLNHGKNQNMDLQLNIFAQQC